MTGANNFEWGLITSMWGQGVGLWGPGRGDRQAWSQMGTIRTNT